MSAEQYSDDFGGQFAQPTVDILPLPGGKRAKGSPEPLAEGLPAAEPVGWEPMAPPPAVAAVPYDAPGYDAPPFGAPAPQAPAPQVPVFEAPSVQAPPVEAPAFDPPAFPAPMAVAPAPEAVPVDVVGDDEAPKKFFGMQVRRPRKKGAEDEVPPAESAPAATNPYTAPAFDPTLASFPPPTAPAGYEAVVAPVAAWPTDSSVSVVADAEPSLPSGAYAAPSPYAPVDLFAHAVDGPPVEAVEAAEPTGPPVEAPVEAPTVDEAPPLTPGNPWMPVPVAVDPPVAVAPVAAAPLAVTVVDAPVAEAPAPSAPLVAEPAPDEARALRALLEASEAGRTEADARAAQATAQVQQAQQQLAQLELDAQSRVAAAETKARKAANDAQDWQIRHREAETTIAELAASVGSAEQRMSEIRAERDDLLAELEAATAPTPSQSPVTQV